MTYDVLKLCKDEGDHFEVDPAKMFPATIARIQEVLAGAPPTEIVSPGWTGRADREPVADKFLRQAEALPAGAWGLKDGNRAAVLDFAESWFKRALALAVGRSVRIHISKNLGYKR